MSVSRLKVTKVLFKEEQPHPEVLLIIARRTLSGAYTLMMYPDTLINMQLLCLMKDYCPLAPLREDIELYGSSFVLLLKDDISSIDSRRIKL